MIKQNAKEQTIQILVGGDWVWDTYVANFEGLSWDGNYCCDDILFLNPGLRRFSFKVIYLGKVFH